MRVGRDRRAIRFLAGAVLTVLMAGCATTRCPMCGHWRSDEARTLAGMDHAREHDGIELTETQIETFSARFFGRLQIECDEQRCRAWYPEDDRDAKSWFAYSLTPLGNRVWERTLPEMELPPRRIQLLSDGSCYMIEQDQFGFGEWFCRVPDDAGK